jgi:hypothetical protein
MIVAGGNIKKRKKARSYREEPYSSRSKWLTTVLAVIFGGLLYLIINAIWFMGNVN